MIVHDLIGGDADRVNLKKRTGNLIVSRRVSRGGGLDRKTSGADYSLAHFSFDNGPRFNVDASHGRQLKARAR